MDFYRYDVMRDFDGYLTTFRLQLTVYHLHRETAKGYWIGMFPFTEEISFKGQSSWVSKTGRKRLAYPTKELAIQSFEARTKKRIRILEGQLNMCLEGLNQAKNYDT